MSHSTSIPAHLFYSQVETDERGNFAYSGDLRRDDLDLSALTVVIHQHLENEIAGGRFSVRGERFAGGRKVIVEALDVPDDLSNEKTRRTFETTRRRPAGRIARSGIIAASHDRFPKCRRPSGP